MLSAVRGIWSGVRASAQAHALPTVQRALATVAVTMNSLASAPGTKTLKMRLGRGVGSGKGKTSGRGHKGQKARQGTGKPRLGFEGGQTVLHKRVPKRGFNNKNFQQPLQTLNLGRLHYFIMTKAIDPTQTITIKTLQDSGCLSKIKHGVKLLGDGGDLFTYKVNIEISQASESAIKRVEELGGSLRSVYFNKLGLRAQLKPHKFHPERLPANAMPTHSDTLAYYQSWSHRGYLSTSPSGEPASPTAAIVNAVVNMAKLAETGVPHGRSLAKAVKDAKAGKGPAPKFH